MKKLFLVFMLSSFAVSLYSADVALLPAGWWNTQGLRQEVFDLRAPLVQGLSGSEVFLLKSRLDGEYISRYRESDEPRLVAKEQLKDPVNAVSSFIAVHGLWDDFTQAGAPDLVRLSTLFLSQINVYKKITQSLIDGVFPSKPDGIKNLEAQLAAFEDKANIVFGGCCVENYNGIIGFWPLRKESIEKERSDAAALIGTGSALTLYQISARQMLSALAAKYNAGIDDLGTSSLTGLYEWDKLKAWVRAMSSKLHPDKADIHGIKSGTFTEFFEKINHYSYGHARFGISPATWNGFRLPTTSGGYSVINFSVMTPEQLEECRRIGYDFVQTVYKQAQAGESDSDSKYKSVVEIADAVLAINMDAMRAELDKMRQWKLSIPAARDLKKQLSLAITKYKAKEEELRSLTISDALREIIKIDQIIGIYLNLLDLQGIQEEVEKEVVESLFEYASLLLKKQTAAQSSMLNFCVNGINRSDSVHTAKFKEFMTNLSGIYRHFGDEEGFDKLIAIVNALSGKQGAEAQRDMADRVFRGKQGGAGSFSTVYTFANLETHIAQLTEMLTDQVVPTMKQSFQSLLKNNYKPSWAADKGAWTSKEIFEVDLNSFVNYVRQLLNYLLGCKLLIQEANVPVVVRNDKEGNKMPVVKAVSPDVYQKVKTCVADCSFIQVVAFLAKNSSNVLLFAVSTMFQDFYQKNIMTAKWRDNFIGDLNAGTMVCSPRLDAVKNMVGQYQSGIASQLGDDAQFFNFFVADFNTLADAYCDLPAAAPSAAHDEGDEGTTDEEQSDGGSDSYTMPANVAVAVSIAESLHANLASFDWGTAMVKLRILNAKLYKPFMSDVQRIKQGDEPIVTLSLIESKGLNVVGDDYPDIKAWLEAWVNVLKARENPSSSAGGSADLGKSLQVLLNLNSTLHLVAAAA